MKTKKKDRFLQSIIYDGLNKIPCFLESRLYILTPPRQYVASLPWQAIPERMGCYWR